MAILRRDLIIHHVDGAVELVDTLLERALQVPDQLGALPAPGEGVADQKLAHWLDQRMLCESPAIDGIRRAGWAARARRVVHKPQLGATAGDWLLATTLPDWVTPAWREPERWRRLAEQRAAGTRLLRLDGFLTPDAAGYFRQVVVDAATDRCNNPYAQAWWQQNSVVLPEWREALTAGPLHTLLAACCGVELPSHIQMNAWRLAVGDKMALHADGTRYAATVSLGLSQDWTATKGGAIAFGWPTADGLSVQERWLPHAGDVLLFAVEATLWHAVEEVCHPDRITLTGQYLLDAKPTA